jgi:hypothetical protein
MLRKKVGLERRLRPEETVVIVSVNDRAERKLTKQFEGLNVEWGTVEAQLMAWGDRLRNGKKLRVDLTFQYVKCILPERTALCGEILRAWHHVLRPFIHPMHIFLQIEYYHHTEEINFDLQLQNYTVPLETALSIAA